MTAILALTALDLALTLGLLYVYVGALRKVRSMHTVGLIVFAALFLVQNAVALYYYATMMPYFAQGLESYALALAATQAVAFGVLNWITWR
jgi:hypothetical protein